MNVEQRIHAFWSGFGLPAYDENTVPDDAKMPYITYESVNDYFGSDRTVSASLWYRSSSWQEITEKQEEISTFIGRGGIITITEDGGLWIKRGTPWANRMSESTDDKVRRIALNINIEFLR